MSTCLFVIFVFVSDDVQNLSLILIIERILQALLKFAKMEFGDQYVMTIGLMKMLMLLDSDRDSDHDI